MGVLSILATTLGGSEVKIPTGSADAALGGILTTVYWVAGITAILVIVVAGLYYVTSQGNAAQVGRAKNAIIAASVGLVVVLMAFTITQFVLGGIQ